MSSASNSLPLLVWRWGVPALALLGIALLLLLAANVPLFQWLNHLLAALGDTWWSHVTVLGDTTLGLLFVLLFIGRRADWVWQFVLAAILASLLSHGLKELLSTPRPPAVLEAGSFHLIGQDLQNNSFPSGHTTTAFVLAGLLCMQILQGAVRYVALCIALLIGLSRIACGVHWPLDVLGGMACGWVSALGGIHLGQRWHRAGENIWLQRVLGLLGLALGLWAILSYDNNYAGTRWLQIAISAALLLWSLPGQIGLWRSKHHECC